MNTWQRVVKYFNEGGPYYSRLSYILFRGFDADVNLLDTYRLYLTRAGYLEHVGVGFYRRAKPIPKNMTSRECYRLAYPSDHLAENPAPQLNLTKRKKPEVKKFYVCGVEWQHELGHALDVRLYESVNEFKKARTCWKTCGIVEIEMKPKWIEPQKFREELNEAGKDRRTHV